MNAFDVLRLTEEERALLEEPCWYEDMGTLRAGFAILLDRGDAVVRPCHEDWPDNGIHTILLSSLHLGYEPPHEEWLRHNEVKAPNTPWGRLQKRHNF